MLRDALVAKASCIRDLRKTGLQCWYLAGIHPRSIPPDLKPEQVPALLEPYLTEPACRGIGEIGLEKESAREREIFMAQLELAGTLRDSGRAVGVHTPRSNKAAITGITLEILATFPGLRPSLVVDHCTPETIGGVLDAGYRAGVTLSPVKTSETELEGIAHRWADRIGHIMCNTDSGSDFFEDAVLLSRSRDLPGAVRRKIFCSNAAGFFSI